MTKLPSRRPWSRCGRPSTRLSTRPGTSRPLTEGQRAVAFAWVLSGLVGNGGFASWIEAAGHRTLEARAALEHLEALEYIPLLDEAARLYPTFAANEADDRLSAADAWTDEDEARLEGLDESFFALAEERDLVEYYATSYVAAHPEDFSN